MANFEAYPEFTEQLRRFETTDPAHAELFNAVISILLNNDVFLKMISDQLIQEIRQHVADKENPHEANKDQIGLGKVDNTSDQEKPISTAQQNALDDLYQQLAAYTNQKIAGLINGAPESLDTLKEVANAIAEHKSVMDALDAAIGKKASAAEFDSHAKDTTKHIAAAERTAWNAKMETTGDSGNNTVAFTSGDATNPTGWADIAQLTSGEKHSSLMRKFSLAVKNVRYLWKLLGSTSLSGIGDGTVTGAIKALNTGIVKILDPSDFITTINDGKITLYMHPWRPNGFYAVYIAQNGTNIWLMLGTLVWNFNVFHTDAGNSSANNIAITGDQGVGITITITNGIIKKDGKFEFIIKGLVVR